MTDRLLIVGRGSAAGRFASALGLSLAAGFAATGFWLLAERLAGPVAAGLQAMRLACALACPAPF